MSDGAKRCEHGRVYDDGRAWTPTTGDPPPDGCLLCHAKRVLAPMYARGFMPPPVKRAKAGPPAPAPRCGKLGLEVIRVAGSQRDWRACGGGHGSTTADARKGLVADCNACGIGPGVWKVGRECGPKCGGYQAAVGGGGGGESTTHRGRQP